MPLLSSFTAGLTSALNLSRPATRGVASPFAPPSHLASITLDNLFPGVDMSTLAPTRASAMRVDSVMAARNRIVTPIAGMPMVTVGGACPLVANPERGRPRAVTLAWTVDQMLWYGRAWWEITERRADDGRPTAVVLRLEDQVTYDPDRGTVTVDGFAPRPATDFIRFDALGEGVLATAGDVLTRAVLVEAAAARAADNPVPSIELHQTEGSRPLSNEEVDALIARWARARRGANGGVAFTGPSVEVKTHGAAAEQLLIQGRTAASLAVARSFGLPAWALDVSVTGSSLTYSNVPSRSRELLDYSLRPYMDAIEGRLSMDDVAPPGVEVRLDPIRLLRGDFADRMNAGKVAIEAGIYSVDEIRALEIEAPQDRSN